ncbi:MAG: RluA family pseudouridine synthase [Bacteroidales bacterium]|nr:RluA family pseudouridine synthase [Bacteroidales bacterium]
MPDIVYEDNHLIIVNKKCGDIVQGDKTGDKTLADDVKSYIKKKYKKPGDVFLGITHRLDRPVSGIVIFAKTSKALTRINKLFAENKIQKTYSAVVNNQAPKIKDTITHYLVRNRKQNKSYANDNEIPNSKKAVLSYELKGNSEKYFLLKIKLHTGRHHQIRAQLAKIGCLIKGDLKYGFPRSNPGGGIHLHARKIEFIHPVKKETVIITANPPDDKLWNFFIPKI